MNRNPTNVLPLSQQDTALSKQRQEFLAKQRQQESQINLLQSDRLYNYETIERIHRHNRKNISSKDSPIRPRRRSKHDAPAHATSTPRRPSIKSRRHTAMLPSPVGLELLNASISSFARGVSDPLRSPRRTTRRSRRRSVPVTNNNSIDILTPSNSPTRRTSISIMRAEEDLVSALNSKFSLNW